MPTANPYVRPVQIQVNQGIGQGQPAYTRQQQGPTYCAFPPNDGSVLPAHFTENVKNVSPYRTSDRANPIEEAIEEFFDPHPKSQESDKESYNIPSQFDFIYATYPNQIFALNQSTEHHQCESGKLPCFGTNQCISRSKWCDSKVDCLDSSDETACSCKSRLAKHKICDGYIDCPMASDELGCFGCDKFQYSCYESKKEFEENGKSSSMMCYSSTEKCDGFTNCKNGNDEKDCSMIVSNIGSMFSYATSYSRGILHRNFRGRWYPVCKNAEKWALEACQNEIDESNEAPLLVVKRTKIPGPFIQPNGVGEPIFPEKCLIESASNDENNIVFVECPSPKCGTSNLSGMSSSQTRSKRAKRQDDTRIVGGINAEAMEFPFIVVIFKDGNFHCGGSIYDEHWIITAAHCTNSFENHFYEVRTGLLRRLSYSPAVQISIVSHVIRHSKYDRSTMKNDIALMRLKTPLSFNRWVRPICLPSKDKMGDGKNWMWGPDPGTICTTLGWGAVRERGPDCKMKFN